MSLLQVFLVTIAGKRLVLKFELATTTNETKPSKRGGGR